MRKSIWVDVKKFEGLTEPGNMIKQGANTQKYIIFSENNKQELQEYLFLVWIWGV